MRTLIAAAALAVVALAPIALTAPASAGTVTVVYGDDGSINWHDADVRPTGFILGQMFITRLRWGHWGALDARATGVIHVCPSSNGCTRHRGTMYLHHLRSHRGHKYFREMTLRWGHDVQRVTYGLAGGTLVFWH